MLRRTVAGNCFKSRWGVNIATNTFPCPLHTQSAALFARSFGSKEGLLEGEFLPHKGVLVDTNALIDLVGVTAQTRLSTSVTEWQTQGLKSAWLRVPLAMGHLIPLAAECGFEFHHISANGDCVMKVWLQPELPDKVPPFATHQVGCAGFVLNSEKELLVMKEQSDSSRRMAWKLPGGLCDPGESFGEACVREVREETGVLSSFVSVLALWNRHNLQPWGQSDMYVVCRLRPDETGTGGARPTIVLDPDEVSDCRWMCLDDFLAQEKHPLIRKICKRLYEQDDSESVSDNIDFSTSIAAANSGTDNEMGTAHGVSDSARAVPRFEMQEDKVQWPGRAPYVTYFPSIAS